MIWIRISDLKSLFKGTDFNSLRLLWSKWVIRIRVVPRTRRHYQPMHTLFGMPLKIFGTKNDATWNPTIPGSSTSSPSPPLTPSRFPQHTNTPTYLSSSFFPGFGYYFPSRWEGDGRRGPWERHWLTEASWEVTALAHASPFACGLALRDYSRLPQM